MVASKISSNKFTRVNTKTNLRKRRSGTSIDSLMIWLPLHLKATVDSYGLAKITMVMSNLISSLKDMALSAL